MAMLTKEEMAYLGIAAGMSAVLTGVRIMYDRRPQTFWQRMLAIFMGALVGTGGGAVGLALGVDPLLAVVVGSLLGSAGEMLLAGVWRVGDRWADDPIKTASEVADVARGQKDGDQ